MYRTGPSFWGWHWEKVPVPGALKVRGISVSGSDTSKTVLLWVKLWRCQNDRCVTTR